MSEPGEEKIVAQVICPLPSRMKGPLTSISLTVLGIDADIITKATESLQSNILFL